MITLLSGRPPVPQQQANGLDRFSLKEDSITEKPVPTSTISLNPDDYKQSSVKSTTKPAIRYPVSSSDPKNSQVDQGRVIALQTAMLQAALYKVSAEKAGEQITIYREEWFKCRDKTTETSKESAAEGVPLSPGGIRAIEETCENGIQSSINYYQAEYDKAMYQYNEYARQVNQLLAECPSCATFINTK